MASCGSLALSATTTVSMPSISSRVSYSFKSSPHPSPLRSRSLNVVAMATPTPSQRLSQSIKEAEELCAAEGPGGECAAAWDEVEEISAAIAHKREGNTEEKDPLEKFCKDSPEADECRVYED